MKLKLSDIITDSGTQMREALSEDTITEYMQLSDLPDLPAITVYRANNGKIYLADGFHRVVAALRSGKKMIDAIVFHGELRDAILHAAGANADHGLRRKPEDKRRAVMALLEDGEWSGWSDSDIARKCHVTQPFVSKLRKTLTYNVISENGDGSQESDADNTEETRTYTTKHGTKAEMKTGKIGKKRTASAPEPKAKVSEPENPLLEAAREQERAFVRYRRVLRSYLRDLLEFAATEQGDPLLKHEQSFQTHVDAICGYIANEEPHCICYACHGAGCDSCEQRGVMTKRRHDSRIPSDPSAVIYV